MVVALAGSNLPQTGSPSTAEPGQLWAPYPPYSGNAGSPGKAVSRPPDMLPVDAQIYRTHDMHVAPLIRNTPPLSFPK